MSSARISGAVGLRAVVFARSGGGGGLPRDGGGPPTFAGTAGARDAFAAAAPGRGTDAGAA